MNSDRFEARFYECSSWDNVTCHLCPHQCAIAPSRTGACGVRSNRGGKLYVDFYGKISYFDVVYAEDLPLFHYKPEINWMRLGGKGCTMRCPFCNSYRFSLTGAVRTAPMTPQEVVDKAAAAMCRGISFGINEPAPMHEYVYDVFKAAQAKGISTHLATGGFWSKDPLVEMMGVTDAVTVGLKGMSPTFYREHLGANLETVLENLDMLLALNGVHVEISCLVIPGVTDQESAAARLCAFLAQRDVSPPLLLLPYQPDYTWTQRSHPASLDELKAYRSYFVDYPGAVYTIHGESAEMNTRCGQCGRTLVRRGLARAVVTSFPSGRPKDQCPNCGARVPYVIDKGSDR